MSKKRDPDKCEQELQELQQLLQRGEDRWRRSRATMKIVRQRAWAVAHSASPTSPLLCQAIYEFCYERLRQMVADGSLDWDRVGSWDPSHEQNIALPAPELEPLDGNRELQQLLQDDRGRWRRSQATMKRLRRRAWAVASLLAVNSPLGREVAYGIYYKTMRRMVIDGTLAFEAVESWSPSPADKIALEKLMIRGSAALADG